jgi:GT2 family glycosyltransferase
VKVESPTSRKESEIAAGDQLKAYIVIVNWNGWEDTIECLESVFRLRRKDFVVIVCDNDSKDGSMQRIMEWARGERTASSASAEMRSFTCPPVARPIPFSSLHAQEVSGPPSGEGCEQLVLIQSGENLGFAGGNNLGLRYALYRNDHNYVWLLNNDVVVHPDALSRLVERMEEDPRIGICGSKLCFYAAPLLVQAYGGASYSPLTGRNRHLGEFELVSAPESRIAVEDQLGYIVGASLLVSRRFLSSIGFMNEDYFLYYEELDWAARARGKFLLGYAPESIVYHKQGSSIGGKSLRRKAQPEESFVMSDFYSIRNQILYTRRYYPQYLPTVGVTVAWRLLKRIAAGKRKRAWAVIRGVYSALSGKHPRFFFSLGRGDGIGL